MVDFFSVVWMQIKHENDDFSKCIEFFLLNKYLILSLYSKWNICDVFTFLTVMVGCKG